MFASGAGAGDDRCWRKSSHSGAGNDCVEVALSGHHAAVRDSKNPAGGALEFGPVQWRSFLRGDVAATARDGRG